MKEAYDIVKLILAERCYSQRFSDEHYINRVEEYKKYFPDRTADEERKDDEEGFDNYLELDIPIGCSRIGGPIVDLPIDIEYPEGYYFMAQLNCTEIKPFDKIGLLPGKGFIYFFAHNSLESGLVFYAPNGSETLQRIVKEHVENYYSGKIIEKYIMEKESAGSRSNKEKTKIYGNGKNKIILLQIGSDYAGEGCQSVFINRNDLVNKDFTKCIFEYKQS